jgi:prephenate dehydratase
LQSSNRAQAAFLGGQIGRCPHASEAAAIQLLGEHIETVPRATFDAAFRAISEGAAEALLVPVENTLAGSVVRVYDLLLESGLRIVAETILHIEHQLIGCAGATVSDLRSVASHPVALAQCERFFLAHPGLKRLPAEDTAGSVREVLARGDKSAAAIAGRRAAERYKGVVLAENIHDNPENFTRFVLLLPGEDCSEPLPPRMASPALADLLTELKIKRGDFEASPVALKMTLALKLAHKPGSLLAALDPFAQHGVNLLKIESRPIHGRPWEYQFFLDVETVDQSNLHAALEAVRSATSDLRVLGLYPPAHQSAGTA